MKRIENIKIAYLCSHVSIPVLGFKGYSVHVREMCSALTILGADVSIFALSKVRGNQYPDVTTEGNRFRSLLGGQTTDYEK